MTYFWILAAVMVMVALGIILPPLLGRSQHATVSRRALNLAVFQERMDDLELEHRQGKLSAEELVQVRSEVERELIYDLEEPAETQQNTLHPVRAGALAVGIVVPLLSVLLYLQLGNREALQLASSGADAGNSRESAVHPGQKPGQEMPSLDEMIAGLTNRLESEPDNLQGWIMLGRSYQVMERFEESKEAFAQAYALAGDDPEVLARYAE
ncbi:MAG: c-type cytochrome biogenesis protein CcmI, partial [Gammaproteobacteria bacterium]|nr:c-type cytochrome biogenesis protein CcmI [Gammaproteobacteria bacterium]